MVLILKSVKKETFIHPREVVWSSNGYFTEIFTKYQVAHVYVCQKPCGKKSQNGRQSSMERTESRLLKGLSAVVFLYKDVN